MMRKMMVVQVEDLTADGARQILTERGGKPTDADVSEFLRQRDDFVDGGLPVRPPRGQVIGLVGNTGNTSAPHL